MKSTTTAIETGTETKITVSFPDDLYQEIQRLAVRENWPESKVVIMLTRLGTKSQKQMEQQLHSSYEAFIAENDPEKKDQLGDAMLRSIFGPEAIAQAQLP